MEPYATIRGKLNKSSNLVFRYRLGRQEVYLLRHPYRGPFTDKQQRSQEHFSVVAKLISGELRQRGDYWRAQFERAPKRFKTLRGFVFSMLYKSLFS